MTLELFEQGTSVYVPVLIISILITAVSYAVFPLLFARIRKKGITARKYRVLCYLFNFFVMLFFIALNGSFSGAPYVLWTSIFVPSGLKSLKHRNLIVNPDAPAFTSSSEAGMEYSGKYQQPAVPDSLQKAKNKNRFCKLCGNPIDPATKKCTGCGKQHFRLPITKRNNIVPKIVAILSVLIVGLCVYRIVQYQSQVSELNTQISELETELASAKQTTSDLQDKYREKFSEAYDLSQENAKLESEIAFYDKYVVFVLNNSTNTYHKYDCIVFQYSDSSFWAYNTDAAISMGFSPCFYCID